MSWIAIAHGLVAIVISATVLTWTAHRIASGRFDAREDLPLDLCNLSALLAPAPLLFDSSLFVAWSVSVGGPGGAISILTPDLDARHDRATRVKFWLVHNGLVASALLLALQARPSGVAQLPQLLGAAAVLVPIMAVANLFLGANYFFLRHKPPTPSLLDVFGRWPHYLAPMVATAAAAIAATYGLWTLWWARG